MTKPKMPEPVAIYKPEYGICWTSSGMAVEAVDGIQFITTTQAEAYKDACVRAALESAAQAAERLPLPRENMNQQASHAWERAAIEAGRAIRALIPPTE